MIWYTYILWPFSVLYAMLTAIRNWLFDSGLKKTYHIPVKCICIGNLSVGGTGKSPLTAWLITQLHSETQIAVLSRGYGRDSKSYVEATAESSSKTLGDEPLMYYRRFGSKIRVAVCEDRKTGIKALLSSMPEPQLILLDDAFQHRKVKAGFNIVVSDYSKPFFKDYLLPMGRLRESRRGIRRADVLIFTKVPKTLNDQEKAKYIQQSGLKQEQVYFSSIQYAEWVHIAGPQIPKPEQILLVTGIANPQPLFEYLSQNHEVELMRFPDHHQFTVADVEQATKKMLTFASDKKVILCTEKDAVRLLEKQFANQLKACAWYYQPMTIHLDREKEFIETIKKYVGKI